MDKEWFTDILEQFRLASKDSYNVTLKIKYYPDSDIIISNDERVKIMDEGIRVPQRGLWGRGGIKFYIPFSSITACVLEYD
jgi:hypothetical protein